MSHNLINRLLPLILVIIIASTVGIAQTPIVGLKSSGSETPHYRNQLPGVLVTRMWDWTTETWNGDNLPYHQARLAIDKVADAGEPGLEKLLIQYRSQAQEKPNNAVATFRWAYTAYRFMLTQDSTITQHKAVDGVQEALRHTDSPHTYDYARIQFLVDEFYTPDQHMIPVAKRLLAIESNDYHVEYSLAAIYLETSVSPNFEAALAICNHLKRLYPAKSSIYALTGATYTFWWYKDKRPSDAHAAVENYEKYLQLAPPKDEFCQQAKWIISQFKGKDK